MAGAKEIRTQIKSIKNTQKITKAMEMVAASKMRRAQDRMSASKPYAAQMRKVIGHLAAASSDFQHPFMTERDVKNVGYIIVTTDRGLCGGLNLNLFKAATASIAEQQEAGAGVKFSLFGGKGVTFFNRHGGKVMATTTDMGDKPDLTDLIGGVKVMLDAFENGELDRVYLVFNTFENTMTQTPGVQQLLPVADMGDEDLPANWDYLYEPEPEELLGDVLRRYVESQVYQAVVENIACEMASRMVAMKAATDNAGSLIDDLNLAYNKARQAAITQELSEIVGGAAAV